MSRVISWLVAASLLMGSLISVHGSGHRLSHGSRCGVRRWVSSWGLGSG